MVAPHAHHIVYKAGIGPLQALEAMAGRAILRRHGIDPIRGIENLTWAPNVKGQHTLANLRSVVGDLRAVDRAGGGYDEIVAVLQQHGELAARRTRQ
jgi:hypothetical protein